MIQLSSIRPPSSNLIQLKCGLAFCYLSLFSREELWISQRWNHHYGEGMRANAGSLRTIKHACLAEHWTMKVKSSTHSSVITFSLFSGRWLSDWNSNLQPSALPGNSLRATSITVEPRLSGPRLSGLFDYPDFFSGPVFFMNINKLWSQKLSQVKNV